MNKELLYQFILVVSILLFYGLFSQEVLSLPLISFPHADKVAHFVGFFLFTGSLLLAIGRRYRVVRITVLLAIVALAVGSEFIQDSSLLPLRQYNVVDVYANLAGLVFGLFTSSTFRFLLLENQEEPGLD